MGLDGCRPTINAAMHGEATALAHVAKSLRNASEASFFAAEAARFRDVLARQLWDDDSRVLRHARAAGAAAASRSHPRLPEARRGREVQTYFGCLACEARPQVPARARLAQRQARARARARRPHVAVVLQRGAARRRGAVCGGVAGAARPSRVWREMGSDDDRAPPRVLQLHQPRAVQLEWSSVALRDVEGGDRIDQPAPNVPRPGIRGPRRLRRPDSDVRKGPHAIARRGAAAAARRRGPPPRRRLLDHAAKAARHLAVAEDGRPRRRARPAARARHPLLPLDVCGPGSLGRRRRAPRRRTSS